MLTVAFPLANARTESSAPAVAMPPAASDIRSKRRRPELSISDIFISDGPAWMQGGPVS
jgi:hypothetical protein